MRVRLERTVELATVQLQLRDWPGLAGPLVHVPDPLSPADDALVGALADTLAPRYRVVSVLPRGVSAYQVDATDLLAVLDQFGFVGPIVLAERLGCVAALLLAAWHPRRLAALVLVDPRYNPPSDNEPIARALKDCPPDWASLRRAVGCPVLELPHTSSIAPDVEHFLAQLSLS